MSNEKFTHGEWEIEEREAHIRDTHMFSFAIMTKEHRICMCQTDDDRNIPQMRANAALIAAAKEMYEELKQLSEYFHKKGKQHKSLKMFTIANRIDHILKKARGEE